MAILFDLFLLAVMLFVFIADVRKGFLRSSVRFARIFLSFAAAFFFSGVFAALFS